ncbi:hypothetical protein [Amycolatopsis sp. MEPSY49]|uniref:hypothetical protein n=1 Tax=Amycolatopsis sp. MEPSY49 TaxID=3151600 RepID=UPI003EF2FAB6
MEILGAFGEFVGPRGEPASCALGWTTGSDPHVARLWGTDQVMRRGRRAWWIDVLDLPPRGSVTRPGAGSPWIGRS